MTEDGPRFPVLEGTVNDLKAALPVFDGDLEALLDAEKQGKNRSTAIAAITEEMEARDTADTDTDTDTDTDAAMEVEAAEEVTEEEEEVGGFAALKRRIQERLNQRTGDAELHLHARDDMDREYVLTGIPGFDELFDYGIPKNSPVLLAGGAGSGKTIFGLQTLAYHAAAGENCLFMSFEESPEQLKEHMRGFGWDPDPLIEAGNLLIKKYSPFDITRKVEAALAKEQGELMIDVDPVIMPDGFDPEFIVVDSLTAIASAFTEDRSSYRIYVDQLFDFFDDIGATSFLITETRQEPEQFSPTGVEEFLADGVIVLYNFRRGNVRENAVEVLKMRGASHRKKIVSMQITGKGLTVYPDQEVFSAME